jgi:hypothetical protein
MEKDGQEVKIKKEEKSAKSERSLELLGSRANLPKTRNIKNATFLIIQGLRTLKTRHF